MMKLYDTVKIKKTNQTAKIIETDDNEGTQPTIYLVEVVDEEKPSGCEVTDVVFWCEEEDIQQIYR